MDLQAAGKIGRMGSPTGSRFRAVTVSVTALTLVLMLAGMARAASVINYGNFGPVPPGVTFTSVTESSGTDAVPLYGAPTPFTTGLDFDPTGFVAFASGGGQDVTDGQLNFGITAPGGINSFNIFEAGDYSLVGTGTAATSVFAGVISRVTVLEVNGVAVVPFDLPPSNASVGFNLIANSGVVQPWSLGTGNSIILPAGQTATKIEVSINNQLLALSESGSAAFIAKKDFRITVNSVPEPASMGLACGAIGLVAMRRRRASGP